MNFLRCVFVCMSVLMFYNMSYAVNEREAIPSIDFEVFSKKDLDSILQNERVSDSLHRVDLIKINKALLSKKEPDSSEIERTLAILYSKNKNADEASKHIKKYIKSTQDFSILNDHVFSDIKEEKPYDHLIKEYKPNFNFLSIIHGIAGIVGIFIVIVLLGKKNLDRVSVLLIGCFILFHSIFTIHISLFVSNYNLKFPHFFYASTPFSFLYGPLLYFYFKRVVQNYNLVLKDALHLIPTVCLLLWLVPYFMLSGEEKFNLLIDNTQSVLISTKVIVLIKALSLSLYAIGVYGVYKDKRKSKAAHQKENRSRALWERNIMIIFVCYAFAYILHGTVVVRLIEYDPFTYVKSVLMIGMIFYMAFMCGLRPEIIVSANKILDNDSKSPIKYKKSNLTMSLSNEIKENLINLFTRDKVYKKNDISLEILSEMLGTTRHNASQVINEHFKMSFHELVNHFRIMEAVNIFDEDQKRNLNIIEVAYEVGYNNKVTFNKAFKKEMNQTPSSYIRSLQLV